MKRDREYYEEEDDDVLRRPEKIQEISSEPEDEIFGSQEFLPQSPGSPFAVNFEFQPPSPTDSESLSDVESISGSQPLFPPWSPLAEDDIARVQRQLNEFLSQRMTEFERAFSASLQQYPDAFKGQDEPMIETVLSSLGSSEPVTTSQPESMVQDTVLPARSFSAISEPVIEKETREEIREEPREKLEEMEEVQEIELDEETAIYISQTAEQVFDDAFNEFLNGAIQKAMQEVPGSESSSQALRLEILYDPLAKNQFDQMRNESLDGLRSEIWELVQQEGMVEG